MRFVRQELEDGAQVYVVTPLIEESEALDVQNAQAMYEAMQLEFPDSQVDFCMVVCQTMRKKFNGRF